MVKDDPRLLLPRCPGFDATLSSSRNFPVEVTSRKRARLLRNSATGPPPHPHGRTVGPKSRDSLHLIVSTCGQATFFPAALFRPIVRWFADSVAGLLQGCGVAAIRAMPGSVGIVP